jgi:DNA recombination protein RmuC
MHDNLQQLVDCGRQLHNALAVFARHLGDLGSRLSSSVDVYNKMISSFDKNVMVKARKFEELGGFVDQDEVKAPEYIERKPHMSLVEPSPKLVEGA